MDTLKLIYLLCLYLCFKSGKFTCELNVLKGVLQHLYPLNVFMDKIHLKNNKNTQKASFICLLKDQIVSWFKC